ncbi:MAG: acetylglutamate kinase [Deltaproteobacteria bacterium]|nr:acetylglutamate kinase [Deltaproteobacteria bacterium]
MEALIEKASVLMEALPYIRKFFGKTVVIKYGGAAMVDDSLKEGFARDVVLMKYIGLEPVIVHGGGPQIGEYLKKMGIESKFHNGIRITDEQTMDVVEMVLVGLINKEIVALINKQGGKAVGLSGKDGGLVRAKKVPKEKVTFDKEGVSEIIDLGRVGNVKEVNTVVLQALQSQNFVPVIAPVGVDQEGEALNINADLMAGAIAGAMKAEKLVLLTDVDGIKNRDGKLLSSLKTKEVQGLVEEQVVQGGMIPKVKSCVKALEAGVKSAHIIDGRVQHALLLEIFTDKGVGTVIA